MQASKKNVGENYYKYLTILVSMTQDICLTFNSLNDIFIGFKKNLLLAWTTKSSLWTTKDHTPTCNELISTDSYFTQITSQPKFQNANQLSPIIVTSVACAVCPSVTTSSIDFSFQNLGFGNLFEFLVIEFTTKLISPTFWIQILPSKFHLILLIKIFSTTPKENSNSSEILSYDLI